ncbi:GGDEF domain-containing protein [Mycolicibacterium gilvum]|uniref:Diguanylate cyclase (GGDEF) domain-containing protein n=1 Tax=Mycolicibacterium gilvum (strain DSM 45189 / LMG 24558 / Spyr1) TaxID=278137 RepID=E6TD72_MYCSR|nr:GGDEF domain-containing protein [Mycolicibacterium gilvum]ADT99780.1 diguanylate cyclase (GGDEF) domain-containing protein [Mycolicibacterium gilvum Spyr1]
MSRIRQRWAQPDHYHWLSGYLGDRKLQGFTRRMMGLINLVLAIVPALMVLSPSGPDTGFGVAAGLVVSVLCALMAGVWFLHWPTRAESIAFSILSNISIAVVALSWPDPLIGLLGCITFAALAGYVAFFHSSHYLVMVLATAAGVAIMCTADITAGGDAYLAAVAFMMIAVAVLAVPFSAQVLVHLLGDDALHSHTDPLTGLRNRRGFYRSVRRLLRVAPDRDLNFLTVAMIDLDRFKQINDTRGHATGDRLLVSISGCLCHCARGEAVVGRVGGEEFLIAEVTRDDDAEALAERLRLAIASTSWGITASVGVACRRLNGDADTRDLLGDLIEAADSAMYEAKRSGGNQYRRARESAA